MRALRSIPRLVLPALSVACAPTSPVTAPRRATPAPAPPVSASASAATKTSTPDASAPVNDVVETIDEASQVRTISLQGVPPITVRQLGAALIEVKVAAPSSKNERHWKTIEIERSGVSGDALAPVVEHDELISKSTRALHTARAGTTYAYRARASGAWSEPVTLRIGAPSAPPPTPTSLTARAETPFAARLSWQADVRGTSGFELEVNEGKDFVRAALVNPDVHEFVHHLRIPGQYLQYRVRAFNQKGASAPSAVASLTMPEHVSGHAAKTPALGRCVHPVTRSPANGPGCDPDIRQIDTPNGAVLYDVPGADFSCRRHLMGDYKGCRREFGVFELQDVVNPVPGASNEGWPLLHAVAGAGEYVGASVVTLQFSHGRYTLVDQAGYCGERAPDASDLNVGVTDDDLTKCFPPFDECQM